MTVTRSLTRQTALAVGLVAGTTTALAAEGAPELMLSYSPDALSLLQDSSEEVVLRLTYYVPPSEAGQDRADESGKIGLGSYVLQIAPAPGVVDLSGGTPDEIDGALTKGPVKVNINVGSARLSAEDNLLACDLYEGVLDILARERIALHCSLITEAPQTILVTGEPELVGPEWRVTAIGGQDVKGDSPVTLQFDADGRLSGSGGCNRLVSSFAQDGPTLTIAAVGATRMACAEGVMAQEDRLTALLDRVSAFRMTPQGTLILEAEDGTAIEAERPSEL